MMLSWSLYICFGVTFISSYTSLTNGHLNSEKKTYDEVVQKSNNDTKISQNINENGYNIVWFDGEMTGLDENKDTLIEAAIIITDGQLNVLAEGPNIIIHQPDEVLENMNDWCKKQHGLSGLIASVRKSNISIEQADQILYDFIKLFTPKGVSPLAGNSIHVDRKFIQKYMPKLESHLNYRIIDVSTLNDLIKLWKPELLKNAPKKMITHRALADIRESVQELKFYKNQLNILK